MKKILGIIASPRRLGNSEIMIKEISRRIEEPHELNLLRFSDFNILPCRGCYQCLDKKGRCPLDDDFYAALEPVLDSDALILAAPAYFLSANSSLKRFLDRGLAFYAHADRLWGKPAVGVAIAGIEGKEGFTLLCIESFLKLILTDMKQSALIYGALPGEIFMNEQNRRRAGELGAALFEPASEAEGYRCPLCGGDTFRFLGGNKVRCMLCSNSGTISMGEKEPQFEISGSEHDFFLTREDALNHKAWLVGMKSRFLQHKKELKEITVPYRADGNWISPPMDIPEA